MTHFHKVRCKICSFLVVSTRALQISITPFLLILDYVKDLILYLILRETLKRLEESCKPLAALGIECLHASGTEQHLVTALFVSFCVSLILTSVNAFFLRKRFFKTNRWLNCVFAFFSPLLPAIYHIKLSQMRLGLDKQKTKLSNVDLRKKEKNIETQYNSFQQIKVNVGT